MQTSPHFGGALRAVLSVAGSLLLAVASFGQSPATGTISGRVLNGANGQYLESAHVSVVGTQIEALTNIYGEYRLVGVPAGAAKVEVFFGGLTGQNATVEVTAGQTVQQDFTMTTASQKAAGSEVMRLDPLVVEAERMTNANDIAINEQHFAPNMKYVMPASAFGTITEGNLGEFLKFLPTVTVDYNSMDARWIMVQGVSPRYTSVTVDGMRMASAASTSPGRFFELEQDSIHNMARAEVSVSRTPDLPADALGGSINMVGLSAFEYAHAELDYDVNLVANSAFMEFGKTPGAVDDKETNKIMPGGSFTYILPLNKSFGLTLAVLDSNMYNPQYRSNPQWYANGTNTAVTATSPYLTNPYLEKYTLQDAPKYTVREAYSADADWKINESNSLSFSVQENYYDAYVHARGISFDTGTGAMVAAAMPANPVAGDYGQTYSDGLAGKGSVTMYSSDRKKFGRTFHFDARFKHDGPVFTFNGGFAFSHASAHYADAANGYPDVISLTMKSVTVNYANLDQFGYIRPGIVNVFNTAATPVQQNPWSYANYNLASITSDPADAVDVMKTIKGDLKRDFDTIGGRTTVTIGAQLQMENRDIHSLKNVFNFTPTGAAALAGNYNFMDSAYSRVAPPWGFPQVQWASNNSVYNYFQANPANFSLVQTGTGGAIAYETMQSPYFTEQIPAGYIMGDTKLLHNRLEAVYGLRYEETHDKIWGGSFDPGLGLSLPAGSVQQLLVQYQYRAAHVTQNYSGVYPSINLTFNITNQLIARAAYGRAVGRPDLNNIIPGYATINTTSQTISAPNPTLAPEQSNNFVVGLQYYPTKGGVLQGDVFWKDFANFWGSTTLSATPALLNQLGLSQDYLGYQITTPLNSGSAQVRGIDVNYRQTLTFLPGWGSGFTVFANGTALHLGGAPNADFTNFIARELNWGVTYAQPRFSIQLNWNFRGRERLANLAFDPSGAGYQYIAPRLETDGEVDLHFTKNITLYLSGRNITNQPWDNQMNYSPNTPGYAHLLRREYFGAIWQLGVKGSF